VDLYRKYGSNIRAIVDILDTPAKESSYLTDVRAGASNFAIEFSTVLSDLRNLDFGSKASSKNFTVRPDSSVSREPVLRIPTYFLSVTLGLALAHCVRQTISFHRRVCLAWCGHGVAVLIFIFVFLSILIIPVDFHLLRWMTLSKKRRVQEVSRSCWQSGRTLLWLVTSRR
jgi:hypothetical protein